MTDLWAGLPVWGQEIALIAVFILPLPIAILGLFRGVRPWPLVVAILGRFAVHNTIFVVMIAISMGVGIGLLAQERGLRQGTAGAAEKFDVIVSAPGSEITMLLATVFLRPSDVPLLDGAAFVEMTLDPRIRIAAPIAYGDNFKGAPIVGTVAEFVTHLSKGDLTGRMFAISGEAVAGASAGLAIGDHVAPAHGSGNEPHDEGHHDLEYEVVGIMAPTGSPWDRAILVPVEAVWEAHGLANGHGLVAGDRIGPPFDSGYVPGLPAVILIPDTLGQAYALQSDYNRDRETMSFIPGAVLSQLYALLGNVRQAVSVMALVSQIIVLVSVLLGLALLLRLFHRELILLCALGAPRRFIFAVVWSYAGVLMVMGTLLGILVGFGAVAILSDIIGARTGVVVPVELGWHEARRIAACIGCIVIIGIAPSWWMIRKLDIANLRR